VLVVPTNQWRSPSKDAAFDSKTAKYFHHILQGNENKPISDIQHHQRLKSPLVLYSQVQDVLELSVLISLAGEENVARLTAA